MSNKSTYDVKTKVGIAILMGMLCLLLSTYGIVANLTETQIDIPWSLMLPILVSISFGWKYGLIAGLAGGVYFPFVLWAENGWANIFTALTFLLIYILSGLLYNFNFLKNIKKIYFRILVIIAISTLFLFINDYLLFNTYLSLNPPFWVNDTIQRLPSYILQKFFIKDSLNILMLFVVSDNLLNIPFVRRIFGLSNHSAIPGNTKIFVLSILTSLFIWFVFLGLSFALTSIDIKGEQAHFKIAFIVILSSGIFVARILFYYNEKQLITHKELIRSEQTYHELFDSNKDGISIFYINPDGSLSNTVEANDSICKLLGYSKDELLNINPSELEVNVDEQRMIKRISDIDSKGYSNFETILRHKDGTNIHTDINVVKLLFNNRPALMNIIRDKTDRKKAEDKLKESEEKYRKAFQTSSDSININSQDGTYVDINDGFTNLTGYTREDVIGKSSIQIKIWAIPEHRDILLYELKKNGFVNNLESKFRCKDGSIKTALMSANVIKLNGEPHTLSMTRDITERILAEEEILKQKERTVQSEEKYHNWFEFFPYATFIWEKIGDDFEMVLANKKAYDDSEGKIKNVFGIKSRILWKDEPDLTDYLFECYTSHQTRNIKREYSFRGSGKTMYVSTTYSFLPPNCVQIITIDITKEREAREALENQKKLFETMFNSIPDGVVITNTDRKVILANNGIKHTFGYEPQDIIGKTTEILYADRNNFEETSEEVFNNSTPINENLYITYYKDINNQIFPGETFGTKLFDLTGKWIGNLGIMRNVSERLKLISELVLAKEKAQESDRLKSAFLANMSHEIRTPMNGILGFAKLLKEPDLSGEEIREFIDIIHLSGTRMLNIINDIVDISKIEAGQMKIILNESNINEQIDYIYTFFKPEVESKGMKLDVNKSLPDELAIITTDREKVYAVFTNLVKNAIKYSIEGTIVLGYQKKNDLIEFYVKDTGIGIHKDRQEAIFERFIQADIEDKFARQGAGLGLAICKSYIDMLGGRIWVESEYGVGSTFYFTLPYFIEPSELILPKDNIMLENNDKLINKLNILIAEDDKISEKLIEIMVKKFAKNIIKVGTGIEAVEICHSNPDIDFILMDIQMPMLNGYEAARQIRRFNEDVIIIAETAYGLSGEKEKAIAAGCNDYIAKPISQKILMNLIQKYFGDN